jgi:DNA-binding MarR family transcriptional regulator
MTTTQGEPLLERWRELESAHAATREALERALQREHQLSLSEYEVLQRLAVETKSQCRMQDLCSDSELSQSALSRIVGRLVGAGFVSRGVCDHDRRGVWAELTDAGKTAQTEAKPTYLKAIGDTLTPA